MYRRPFFSVPSYSLTFIASYQQQTAWKCQRNVCSCLELGDSEILTYQNMYIISYLIYGISYWFVSQIRRTAFFDNKTSVGTGVVIITLQNYRVRSSSPKLFAKITMHNGTTWCRETINMQETLRHFLQRHDIRNEPDDYICFPKKITLSHK